jgi:hypothetical protein
LFSVSITVHHHQTNPVAKDMNEWHHPPETSFSLWVQKQAWLNLMGYVIVTEENYLNFKVINSCLKNQGPNDAVDPSALGAIPRHSSATSRRRSSYQSSSSLEH